MADTNNSLEHLFAENVFSDETMRQRLPKNVYQAFCKIREGQEPMSPALADVIANAMKDWAIEKGATHFCHWFQPMTGRTAEKHDSFISPTADGAVVMEFSGKALSQGEPDASSLPSGGLRATFEARGYTAWDCTSPVFVKEDGGKVVLCIPSAFCSYTGLALDKKTPLLRSMEALNKQALRLLRLLGNTTSQRVDATLGAEQEYFLIDKKFYEQRLDLILTGRTLIGAASPRGQEMDDHYFGALDARVAAYMRELNDELWKLGVTAKTQHNEVAPAQYELAPIFATINVACDHNQLVMEAMQKVASKHDFVCLLHEKPFAGLNGSGKHLNWSISTDDGINLLDPGKTPHESLIFLLMLCAVVRAVDKYAKLLRASVATAGNEHRLGANEAPPAIISVFLGDQLGDIFEQLGKDGEITCKQGGKLELGVSTLPPFPLDSTDRNRTSPFAFTGNKFEFRMPGSSIAPSGPAFCLNAMVADVFAEIADELEDIEIKTEEIPQKVRDILKRIVAENGRVVFNGDNYSDDWVDEAAKRGLPNTPSAPEALSNLDNESIFSLFERHGVLSREELTARTEILLEAYSMQVNVEALTQLRMLQKQVMPIANKFAGRLATTVGSLTAVEQNAIPQRELLSQICSLISELTQGMEELKQAIAESQEVKDFIEQANAYRETVLPAMARVRAASDLLEDVIDSRCWGLPSYAEMLFLR